VEPSLENSLFLTFSEHDIALYKHDLFFAGRSCSSGRVLIGLRPLEQDRHAPL
jgi:hypothetical protein